MAKKTKTTTVEVLQTSVYDQDQNGEPLVTKNGNKYWKAGIKTETDEGEEKWVNGLIFDENHPIFDVNEGDEVKLELSVHNKWGLQFEPATEDFEVVSQGSESIEENSMSTEEAEEELDVDEIPF